MPKLFISLLSMLTAGVIATSVGPPGRPGPRVAVADTCDDLLAGYIELALDQVGPWGLGQRWVEYARAPLAGAAEDAAATTGTNNQVAGVDEADRVKTEGEYVYSLVGSTIHIARIGRTDVEVVGRIDLDWPAQSLLLDGNTLVVIGSGWDALPMESPVVDWGRGDQGVVRIASVDISRRSNPRVSKTLVVDGTLVGSRMVDGTAQLALTSGPLGFEWKTPSGNGLRAEADALAANKHLIRESTLDNWLPWYQLSSGSTTEEGRFTDCSGVVMPDDASGLSTVTLATFDPELTGWSTAGLVAEAATYYATADHTYLASARWAGAVHGSQVTDIHLFRTDPSPRFVASGKVPGWLIGQFALDEHDGVLRVASTVDDWSGRAASESMVTTLVPVGSRLVEQGQISGLGMGERIYAVRFLGDTGYVVTFRQIDPLYTLDLSDRLKPRQVGELKITGYSSYLHPVGEGLLLGVGQEADTDGRTQGTQISLFDLSDPAAPVRLDQVHLADAWSDAEWDHHAFTYSDGVALVPVTTWAAEPAKVHPGMHVLAIEIEDGRLRVAARLGVDPVDPPANAIAPGPWGHGASRNIITPSLILGVSNAGIQVHDRSTYTWLDFVDFALGSLRKANPPTT